MTAVAIAVLPLGGRTELRVKLREDSEVGRVLLEGALALPDAGCRTWAVVHFAGAVVLPAQRHWLVLSAAAGAAVWLAEQDEGGPPALARDRSDANGQAPVVLPDGWTALHRLLSRSGAARDLPGLGLAPAGQDLAAAGTGDGGRLSVDLTAALSAAVQQAAGAGDAVELPLRITASGPGTVTVYAPRIVYDLA